MFWYVLVKGCQSPHKLLQEQTHQLIVRLALNFLDCICIIISYICSISRSSWSSFDRNLAMPHYTPFRSAGKASSTGIWNQRTFCCHTQMRVVDAPKVPGPYLATSAQPKPLGSHLPVPQPPHLAGIPARWSTLLLSCCSGKKRRSVSIQRKVTCGPLAWCCMPCALRPCPSSMMILMYSKVLSRHLLKRNAVAAQRLLHPVQRRMLQVGFPLMQVVVLVLCAWSLQPCSPWMHTVDRRPQICWKTLFSGDKPRDISGSQRTKALLCPSTRHGTASTERHEQAMFQKGRFFSRSMWQLCRILPWSSFFPSNWGKHETS